MTVDDLMTLFQSARQGPRDWNGTEWVGVYGGDRAGVTAIVRALRDETRHMTLNRDSLEELFTQILGDAGEKVTIKETAVGAVLRLETGDPPLPATDAAPAACVWTLNGVEYQPQCGPAYMWVQTAHKLSVKQCRCGKPIKFTEAK